jgi:membrane dipeptidase
VTDKTEFSMTDQYSSSRRRMLGQLAALSVSCALATRRSTAQSSSGDGAQLSELGMTLSDAQRARGVSFLKRHASLDAHAHPGRFFLEGQGAESSASAPVTGAPFVEQAIADLNAGNVSAAVFSAVADMRLLQLTPQGIRAVGNFEPGQAYSDYRRQIEVLKGLVSAGRLHSGRNPAEIERARAQHRCAAIFGVEGGDFIEDQLDRVHAAFEDGVRVVGLVHYHINQIGDIQTEPPVHNGLTALGKRIVREMNRAGILIDLAHAPLTVAKDTIEASDKPVIVSHTNLRTDKLTHPRFITAEHAKLVAAAGGVIGAWPCGFGLDTFADYIDAIQRLVDAVGIDHVAIGTDMDANYKPVFSNYKDWSLVPAALLARGMQEGEVAKVLGGNLLAVYRANSK